MWTKLIRRFSLFCIALFFTIGLSLNHATAQTPPFHWDYINVNIDVQTNGDMLVTETQKYVFTSDWTNQRYRYIPLDKVDEIKEVTVQENNQIIPSETGIENNQFWIRWQHQLKAPESHIFVIKYRVVGGLHINGDNTQVYWKAIFADRKAAVKQAKVTVKFPEQVASSITNFESFGTPANLRKVDAKTIEFMAEEAIEPQQELEVQVTFASGSIDAKTPQWQTSNSSNSSNFSDSWFWIVFVGMWILSFIFGDSSSSSSGGGGGG